MAFAFNAALINDIAPSPNLNDTKPKVNKDSLQQLLNPSIEKTKDKPTDIANIHNNLKEENENELTQFYHKEKVPTTEEYSLINNTENYESSVKPNMLNKVNHIIELLEDQKEIKTNQKNEEIVLYCFLGLFIIYIIDSFVSIGKYSR